MPRLLHPRVREIDVPITGTFDSPLGGGTFTATVQFGVPNPVPVPVPVPVPPPPGPPPTGGIQWPSFQGNAVLAGTSPMQAVSVYYDAALGQDGVIAAQALLAQADNIAELNNEIFGLSINKPVNVIVFALGGSTDGTGGADHDGCDFSTGGNIEVDIAIGEPARVAALFEAELSECAMNNNLCGLSTGESLSRWCAMVTGGTTNPLADFATAPYWAQTGMPDYVTQVYPSDQDGASIGCGMAFISWFLSLGHSLPGIAQAMVKLGDPGTLAQLYAAMTGQPATSALAAFQAAVAALPGGAAAITSDDPWGSLPAAMTAKASV